MYEYPEPPTEDFEETDSEDPDPDRYLLDEEYDYECENPF